MKNKGARSNIKSGTPMTDKNTNNTRNINKKLISNLT